MKKFIFLFVLLIGASVSAVAMAATWKLDPTQSRVSFVSVKQDDIAEVHHFGKVMGQLDDSNGMFDLTIPLASVVTGVAIRDERMKDMLFDVSKFPNLTLTAHLDPSILTGMSVGETSEQTIDAEINIHGDSHREQITVVIAKLSDTKMLVTSFEPVIINAADFGLVAGINSLKQIAHLSTISDAVPVSFVLFLTSG